MDMNQVIKVADFGLSVSVAEDKNYFRADENAPERLPVKWMAPEGLMERKFSELSDVVSQYFRLHRCFSHMTFVSCDSCISHACHSDNQVKL